MTDFLIQYKIDNQIKSVKVAATDEVIAFRIFSARYPDVSLDNVMSVSTSEDFVMNLWRGSFGLPMTY